MRRIVIAAIALVIVAAALFWLTRPKPIPVALTEVAAGRVESTLTNTRAGSIEACLHTKLSTIIGGRIEYLGVKEGDKVKKGQLLLKLWNDDQQANTALAEAQVRVAARRVDEACIAAANAEREARRQAELRQRGFVSASAEEAARTQAEVSRATCHTARADVAQAEARYRATRV
ncbi:MAG: biotin/lipoyl-binding protein, partial [Desulfobulbus sp.]|nr:biotin/lipoyl-binding protein [Desulfobulbus sp.]